MPICPHCNEFYISKTCPHCAAGNVRTDKTTKKAYYVIGAMVVATLVLAFFALRPTNPLIGTWVSATKIPFMGRQKIEFRKDSMITMGIYTKVKYDVDGDTVIVHDDTGTGAVYRVVDKDTIFIEALGIKSVYKKLISR